MATLPAFFGTLPGWVTALSSGGILACLVRRELGLKKLEIEAQQVNVTARQVEDARDADIRDHYADEVKALREALQQQSKRHNDALDALEARHQRVHDAAAARQEKCEAEREKLATLVRDIQEELHGVRAQVRANSAEQVVLLAASNEPVPPHALEAAKRIVARHEDKRNRH
jgi:predicted  nucleic acid-binding Zn-ribbon protein